MRYTPRACRCLRGRGVGTPLPTARRLGQPSANLRRGTVSGQTPDEAVRVDASVLFEKLFEFSPDAVLVADSIGSIVLANAQAERLFAYDRQELVGQPIEMLIPERFRSAHPKHRSNYAAQPHTRPMGAGLELFARRKDGSEFPVDIMLSPLILKGAPFTVAVIRDVTLRKQEEVERDRRASITREQAALLDLAHDSIIVRDLDNRITFWNRGAEEKYGWRQDEALGQVAHTLLLTQFPKPLEEMEQALRREHYWEGEVIHTAKNGKRIVVASRRVLQCDAEGKATAILEINNDVTKRKQTEEALQRSEARLRALFEFSPDAIVVADREGKIGDVNARVEKVFGYKRSELLGQPIEILIPERFRSTHPKHRADYAAHPRVR